MSQSNQTTLRTGAFQPEATLRNSHPDTYLTDNGHPLKEVTTPRGDVLVCQRCGRWAFHDDVDEFEQPCNPDGDHPKHYTVRRKFVTSHRTRRL